MCLCLRRSSFRHSDARGGGDGSCRGGRPEARRVRARARVDHHQGGYAMRRAIVDIINRSIDALEPLLPAPVDRSLGEATPIFGGQGALDSMALVSLIVQIEELVEREL